MKKSYNFGILVSLVTLAIPTVIEEITSTLLQYADTAMVGHLGEDATASVSVTTNITWLISSIPAAIGIAAIAMISKCVGEGDKEKSRLISSQIFLLTVLTSVALGAVCIGLSPFIPLWMGAAEKIRSTASLYFAIISLPMIFRSIGIVMAACLRATKNTKTPMIITFGENVVNIILNYLLIYVFDLKVIGAGIASAVSITISGTLIFAVYIKNDYLRFSFKGLVISKDVIKSCLETAFPVFLTHSINCMGYVVFAGIISPMGTTIFAAHSIAVSAEQIFYIAGYGFRSATSTMIGISIGERDRKKFSSVQRVSVAVVIGSMCASGLLLYLVAHPLMTVFTSSADVADLGSEMLRIVAFTEPFYGLMIVLEGIYYGLSKTKYVFYVESISMWGIRILFTFICVKILHSDLASVWYCMIADNIFKAVMLAVPFVLKRINFPVEKEELKNEID